MAYTIISQNNTTTTLADENGNVITVPARVTLATSTDYTITKVNNNSVDLVDGNGKVIRGVPACVVLAGGGGGGDQHNLGYYATQAALEESHPTAEPGDWAIVGATDTVWVWDEDTSAWVDTDTKGEVTPDMVIIKSATMPTPSTTPVGAIYQYTGATNSTYTHDYIYENVSKTTYNGTITEAQGGLTFDNTHYSLGDFFGGLGIANYQNIEVFMLFCMGDPTDPDADWAFAVADGDGAVLGMPLLKKAEIEAGGFTFVNSDSNFEGTISLTGTTANVWEVIETGNQVLQCADMPFPMPDIVGKIVQYTGTTGKYTNGYFYKCVVVPSEDPDISDTYAWEQTNVQPAPSGLPDQTGQSGKFLTTDGTDASWSDKPLVNKTTAINAICITSVGDAKAGSSIAIGSAVDVKAGATGSITVGSVAGAYNLASYSIAIGHKANTNATGTIQLCASNNTALNSDANTFKVANANGNYEIMSADGTIPTARFATDPVADGTYVPTVVVSSGVATRSWAAPSGGGVSSISVTLAAASWSGGSQTVTATGVTASNTVIIGAAPASQAEYTTCGVICTSQSTDSLGFTCTSTPTNDLSVTVLILA